MQVKNITFMEVNTDFQLMHYHINLNHSYASTDTNTMIDIVHKQVAIIKTSILYEEIKGIRNA